MLTRIALRIVTVLLLCGIAAAALLWATRAPWTEETVRQVIVTTIQSEAPQSFYVAGYVALTTTVSAKSSKELLPYMFSLDLGTTEAEARVPGRVFYGFDVRELHPAHIRILDGGIIEVSLPELEVYTVAPDMAALEMKTSVGWARMYSRSGREMELAALRHVNDGMHAQGVNYLKSSHQPRINTARAIKHLLTPGLQAAGIMDPVFRFRIGDDLVSGPAPSDT